jgi:ABC-type amino acid transport substrate-binding protein
VPAVVLFSVMVGVALIGVERKQPLMDLLIVVRAALSRVTHFLVRLTPVGLFAIAAVTAGTLDLEQFKRIEVYLVAYILVALLVSLWVLPGLVSALTPIGAGEILSRNRNALVTAFMTADLFIVLPFLTEASKELLARHRLAPEHAASTPDVVVPASFNFPHTGKLLSLSFILFAGWFSDVVIPITDRVRLGGIGLVSFFGSLQAAVPFLLDVFRIPADTMQLFHATGVINSRFGALLAAVHTLAVALLGTCAITGTLRFQPARLVRFAVVTVVLTAVTLGGARILLGRAVGGGPKQGDVIAEMRPLYPTVEAAVHRDRPAQAAAAGTESLMETVRRRGALRIGYAVDSLPFAYFNRADDLVGFDVDLAHQLARELQVRLEFVPVDRDRLGEQLDAGDCDIVMSGIAVTTLRASRTLFSTSYLDETLSFVVRDHRRDEFSSWEEIRARSGLVLAVRDLPYYIQKVKDLVPQARLHPLRSAAEAFGAGEQPFDAAVLPAERASAWTLLYPKYSVVVPEPGTIKIPLAYPVARRDELFASFLNTWIELKRKDGTIDALYKYWILGQNAAARRPRWSILRDVLQAPR